ncbi:TetR/AcrR family transcriptional regulator [Halostreptopolyspora alba]|uniref:TetR/AcrR family transcriptional regulator n=1 Tax=Halostreptopolyspora alba TaxID=2487137 RepID=A0A3N0EDT8_9ACTN|nr:TetR/AcrR family transcriptional regulator [Nocardiopsaceae bacterium YIM 96095]
MTDHYHHGDLRRAVLDRALEVIAAQGAEALNLRAIAADLGVTHTAPRHHFGNRQGVLTAIATEGFTELARRLRAPEAEGQPFLEAGVAYVEFALARPAHFQVMFQPTLLDDDDEALAEAEDAAFAVIRDGVAELERAGAVEDAAAAVIAGWGLMHGVASLALSGSLDKARVRDLIAGGDIVGIARRSGGMLYGSPSTNRRAERGDTDD